MLVKATDGSYNGVIYTSPGFPFFSGQQWLLPPPGPVSIGEGEFFREDGGSGESHKSWYQSFG